jgi:hypothetical protein
VDTPVTLAETVGAELMKKRIRTRETRKGWHEEGNASVITLNRRFHTERNIQGDRLITGGWNQDKPCRVTMDTGVSVTIARPYIVAGQPKRKPSGPYVQQLASRETMPVLKEALVELILWRSAS